MIKRFSIDIFKPNWPKWKKGLANLFLLNLPILHVGRVNKLLDKIDHHKNGDFIIEACKHIGIEYELHNADSIPKSGAVTIVANHPGGADIVGALAGLWGKRHDFKILANSLICLEPIADMVIPVDVMKKSDKVDESLIHKAYQNGEMVVFFAAGKNSRYNKKGELKDRRWRTSFLDFAHQYDTPILVLNIDASNTPLFYKISNFRENNARLKKVPLENMFQLREIYKQKGRKVNLLCSNPIQHDSWKDLYKESDIKTNRLLADRLYDFLYSMNTDNTKFKWKN